MRIRLFFAALTITTLAGCAAHRTNPGGTARDGFGSHLAATSAATICRQAFASSTVLGWEGAKAAELRAYQYGGPVAHRPLRSAFPGVPATARGAWCLVRQGPGSESLWGAVPGRQPERAITISGPGEDRHVGRMNAPPEVP